MKALRCTLSICLCASLAAWQNMSNFPTTWLQWASNCCVQPPPHPPCHKHSHAFSVDTASVGIPTLYASSCSDPPTPTHTHTHIRGPAIRPHTWACLQRKRPGRAALHAPVDWLHNVWPAVSLACPEPSLWGLNTQLGKACFPKREREERKRKGSKWKTEKESKGMRKAITLYTTLYFRIQIQ